MKEPPEYLPSTGRLLGFATRAVSALTHELLAEHGLSPPQWIALTALWRQDGLTVSQVAEYTKSKLPAVSRLLGRMEDEGLVQRLPHPTDRRTVELWLTPKSKKMKRLLKLYERVNDVIVRGLSPKDVERLNACLKQVTANASEEYAQLRGDDPLVL